MHLTTLGPEEKLIFGAQESESTEYRELGLEWESGTTVLRRGAGYAGPKRLRQINSSTQIRGRRDVPHPHSAVLSVCRTRI